METKESGQSENLKKIEALRKELDEIDAGILELFQERMTLVESIGLAKKEENLPVEDGAREAEILKKVADMVEEKNLEDGLALMKSLIDISKNRQRENGR